MRRCSHYYQLSLVKAKEDVKVKAIDFEDVIVKVKQNFNVTTVNFVMVAIKADFKTHSD